MRVTPFSLLTELTKTSDAVLCLCPGGSLQARWTDLDGSTRGRFRFNTCGTGATMRKSGARGRDQCIGGKGLRMTVADAAPAGHICDRFCDFVSRDSFDFITVDHGGLS